MPDFSEPKAEFNPYAPPIASFDTPVHAPNDDEVQILAERGTRFFARLLDGILIFAALIPMVVVFAMSGFALSSASKGGDTSLMMLSLTLLVVPLALFAYQWSLIARQGQTLGKKWLGIKIVKLDGSPVNFASGVVLRNWVMSMVGNVPYLGFVASLANVVMIFGQERRCLHDQIAGTKVILALPGM